MIVAFAGNQVMFGKGDNASTAIETITTDPVPMNGMNRASAILDTHSFLDFGNQGPVLTATGQVSNDGVNWVDTDLVVTGIAAGPGTPPILAKAAEGQFIRFKFEWQADVGTAGLEYAFICFDLHVRLDHS